VEGDGIGGSVNLVAKEATDTPTSDASHVNARYLYSDFKNYGDRWAYQIQDNTSGTSLLVPGNQDGTPSYDGEY
jgi:hypothetical protein